jgi:hypothetical protein
LKSINRKGGKEKGKGRKGLFQNSTLRSLLELCDLLYNLTDLGHQGSKAPRFTKSLIVKLGVTLCLGVLVASYHL